MTISGGRPRVSTKALLVGTGVVLAMFATVTWSFFAATTFIGDDHLFLAFARHAPNPLTAFVRDQHGGEFYRPLSMLVWWLLGRAAALAAPVAGWPFAALALALHTGVAALLFSLLSALGRSRLLAIGAAVLFFLAPQNLEAAYWFSASTDLLATAFVLASLLALVRGRPMVSALLALGAYLSKESALVLPALAFVVLGAVPEPAPLSRRLRAVAPHAALAAAIVAVRFRVLGGWGGSGDAAASGGARALQLASGLVHLGTGAEVLPQPLAWGLGAAALGLLVFGVARASASRGARVAWAPLAYAAIAVAPLLGAGWIVGARYFYLPAVGLAWAAGEVLASRPPAARMTLWLALFALGLAQAGARRQEVVLYQARLAAARRAVGEAARHGARVVHIAAGIKDLDLAVKEDRALGPTRDELLVLADVPASFVDLPPTLAAPAAFLLAAPPLPPSGAYRFGEHRIVGLARRGEDPTLDEVVARFPDIRFIRLRPTPGGHIIARDVTDELKGASD